MAFSNQPWKFGSGLSVVVSASLTSFISCSNVCHVPNRLIASKPNCLALSSLVSVGSPVFLNCF